MLRYTVHYRGRVQGVGFRYTARRVAQGRPVAGYVMNLPDGRVELVAEGEPTHLDAYLDALAEQMQDYIHDRGVATSPATGEFGGEFAIRH